MKLSVIIPAYNEAQRIKGTLLSVGSFLTLKDYEYEVIVVDDGSTDSTVAVVNSCLDKVVNLRIVRNVENHGKGWVVQKGMNEATGGYRLFMDADNSTSINHIDTFMKYFKEGYDIVIGSRRIEGAVLSVRQSRFKELLGRLGNLWIRIFAVGGIKDTQAGFKMFTANASTAVFSRQTLNRWGFDFELLAIAKKHGLKTKEAPITWVNDERSHVSSVAYVKTFFEALKVRWNIITGKYK
jgi:dolichyl-phosphate beta-glucosyltransferase